MNCKQTQDLLDANPAGALEAGVAQAVESHSARCDDCRKAVAAAKLARRLIQARAAQSVEAPPFFNARVMAAWAGRSRPSFQLWRTARLVLSSMLGIVLVLFALNFLAAWPSAAAPGVFPLEERVIAGGSVYPASGNANNAPILDAVFSDETSNGSN